MCDVMERAVNKGKEEVREEERINSIKVLISSLEEFGISSEAIIEKVMEKFNFSRDEATKYVNKQKIKRGLLVGRPFSTSQIF